MFKKRHKALSDKSLLPWGLAVRKAPRHSL